ncbi:replication endonuclease [Pseudomonas sp. Marseille-P8916]|uniref:replication endonuclease n=1 Tax=Pseudomonas sp. Marseille-P8916 TaxID=2866589 RepID=UPI001CE44A8F|nr:replication endonuclease [Pseudomonas sp. Marseille-P8916]
MLNPPLAANFKEELSFNPAHLPPPRSLSRYDVARLATRISLHYRTKPHPKPNYNNSKYFITTEIYGIVVESKLISAISERLECKRFWKQALEKKANQDRLDHEARYALLGETSKNGLDIAQLYCSNETLERERQKRSDNEKILSNYKVINTRTNQEESLLAIAQTNEQNRVSALYFTAKSLERLAHEKNFIWIFVTLTAPSKYHPNPLNGRRTYDAELGIKASHNYINTKWKQIRASLNVKGIKASPDGYFGFRTVEPHKDGSIHWHLLMFVDKNAVEDVASVIKQKFPEKYAADVVYGKQGAGSATAATYLYKYISKSVSKSKSPQLSENDIAVDLEREARDLASMRNKERVQACLAALRIRQYQLFGVCNLTTVFKKINKLDLESISPPAGSILHFIRNDIWRNTDGYLNMIKNSQLFKKNSSIELLKEPTKSRYGEPREKIVGIRIDSTSYFDDKKYKIIKC